MIQGPRSSLFLVIMCDFQVLHVHVCQTSGKRKKTEKDYSILNPFAMGTFYLCSHPIRQISHEAMLCSLTAQLLLCSLEGKAQH